jgi:hypothetical protein
VHAGKAPHRATGSKRRAQFITESQRRQDLAITPTGLRPVFCCSIEGADRRSRARGEHPSLIKIILEKLFSTKRGTALSGIASLTALVNNRVAGSAVATQKGVDRDDLAQPVHHFEP